MYPTPGGGLDSGSVTADKAVASARLALAVPLPVQFDLLELSQDAIIVRDLQSRILYWNTGAERLYGWPRADALGQVADTLLNTRFPVCRDKAERCLQVEGHWEGDLTHTARDGRQVIVESRQVVRRSEDGAPMHILEINRDITSRRLADETLRRTAESLSLAQEASMSGVWDWHMAESEVAFVSPEYRDLYGFSPDEPFTYEKWLGYLYPEDRERADKYGREFFSGEGTDYAIEFRIIHPLRGERWLAGRGRLERGDDGRPVRFTGINIDITERKRGENALRAAHDTFHYLVQNSPFGVYAVDADFRLAQASAGAQKVFENVRPLLGRDFAEVLRIVWPEPFASEAIGRFRHTLATGEPFHAPSTVERRNDIGEVESYDWKIERVILPDTRFGVVCHFYDLSERQRFEAAISESEERLRLALEAANGIAFDWDVQAGHVHRTGGLLNLLGYDRDEVPPTGEWWTERVHPDDLREMHQITRASYGDETSYRDEYRVKHRRGHYIYVLELGQIVRGEQGDIRRIIGITVDISRDKQAQQEIADLNTRLRRAVSESNHRIKNNLQVLSAILDMAVMDAGELVPRTELERMGIHIRTLAALHELLTKECTATSLGDTLSLPGALQILLPILATFAGRSLTSETPDDIRVGFKQGGSFMLLVNELVSNAIKHGQGDVHVRLSGEEVPPEAPESRHVRAKLEVSDNGPGFPPGFDPKIASNTGLALVESMARWDLQGELRFENRPEGGARVVVTFPVARIEPAGSDQRAVQA